MKHDAPTTRANSSGWAVPSVRCIIGLSMLNAIGITALNHLPVVAFNMPQFVLDGPFGHTATLAYSYRLNVSMAPRSNYERDLAQLVRPFVLIAGTDDESFHGERHEPLISPHTAAGRHALLEGVDHLGVVDDAATVEIIRDWLNGFQAK
ncbi:MAG: hypothetical protein WBO55_02735 [Rhizobiaceae bacterium]